jgi:hypothetical protein
MPWTMKLPARRLALTAVSAALIMVFNTLPLGLPPSMNPLPLRVPSTVVTLIVSILDPWAGAFGALIGHFSYDYMFVGIGATPALFGCWCYVPFGYLMRRKGGSTLWRLILGSAMCIGWVTLTLTLGFWALGVMPVSVAFYLILTSITLTFILSDLIMIPILPRLRHYIDSISGQPSREKSKIP